MTSQSPQGESQRQKREPLEGNTRFEKIQALNSGSYGFVYLCKDLRTGELVAIKFIERGEKVTKYVERELLNHNRLLHPHIVQFREAFAQLEVPHVSSMQVFLTNEYLGIAMEYAPGGDMFQYVKQRNGLQEYEARWFFQQLIVALDYCHRLGVVSRDVKLENCLLDFQRPVVSQENTLLDNSKRPLVKMCDFGYSKHAKDSLPKSKVGTPGYTAPEVISNRKHYDGVKADIWSSGVMLYVMLFGQYPFERPEDKKETNRFQKVLYRIIAVDYHFPASSPHGPVSEMVKDLIRRIFVADPAKRMSIQEMQRHPWYQQDLPPGLTGFNDICLAQQRASGMVGSQSEDQIKAIVQEAKTVRFANSDAPVFHDDVDNAADYIDDVMDNEELSITDRTF